MAFVKIVKDGCRPMKVPAKSIPKYESCGWKVSGKKSKLVVVEEVEEIEEENESEEVEEEVEETKSHKSVDDMTMEELQDKAKELGVNTKNLTTIGALKKAVKRAMAND